MRIALVSTSSGPVRRDRTGSVESQVWLLSRELTAQGHRVTVFGCAGSEVPCELVVVHPGPYATPGVLTDWQLCDWVTLAEAVAQSDRFDIIHSHAYLWALPLERFSQSPMVHTMHTCPYANEAILWNRFPDSCIVALSAYQWSSLAPRQPAAVIPNGVDAEDFTFVPESEDYVCYLGRFTPGKGPLEAIAAARQADIPIILAGHENDYFNEHIRHLIDGQRVRFIGSVDRLQRNELLGRARALLYPLREPEPFGLVQVEAMMCGTPVVAIGLGAVPEIVQHGTSGLIVNSAAELPSAIRSVHSLDRRTISLTARERFSATSMATRYMQLYERRAANPRST